MTWNLVFLALAVLGVLALIVRQQIKLDADSDTPDQTSQNDHLIEGGWSSGGLGGGHSHTYRVTRDPGAYARAFVPTKRKEKK